MLIEVLVLIVIGVVTLLGYVSWSQGHWRRVGVPTLNSTFILGSLGDAILKKKATSNVIKVIKIYTYIVYHMISVFWL
jgi:hypothetical protein